jgi:hypothetical protein
VAMAVVARLLTSVPIKFRLRQWIRSGMSAKGMPQESTTWLMTRDSWVEAGGRDYPLPSGQNRSGGPFL